MLTGRNHHTVHMGGIPEAANVFPGYDSVIPKEAASVAEILKLSGGMNCFGATDALLISTSRLTKKALDAANRCNVQVYEGDTLKELCLQNRLMLPSWSLLISSSGAGSPLITRDLMIGRDPLCDVAVTADRTLSRNHFDLKWDRSRLVLRDLSSSNGTRLNGKRVNDPVVVCYGDVI
jgi:hypothetical protein